jgi:hypothetical protein
MKKAKVVKSKKTETEKMIYEIFRLCDGTVWLEDWFDFQKSFEKILKKFGHDLYPIYFGKSKKEFIKHRKETYDKWVGDKAKQVERSKKKVAYIKDRPQKMKLK